MLTKKNIYLFLICIYFFIVFLKIDHVFKDCIMEVFEGTESSTNDNSYKGTVTEMNNLQEKIDEMELKIGSFENFLKNEKKIIDEFPSLGYVKEPITDELINLQIDEFFEFLKDDGGFEENSSMGKIGYVFTKNLNQLKAFYEDEIKTVFLMYVFKKYEKYEKKVTTKIAFYQFDEKTMKSICNLLTMKATFIGLQDKKLKNKWAEDGKIDCTIDSLKKFFGDCKELSCEFTNIFSLNEELTKIKMRTENKEKMSRLKEKIANHMVNFYYLLWGLFYKPKCYKLTIFFIVLPIQFTAIAPFPFLTPIPIIIVTFYKNLSINIIVFGLVIWLSLLYHFYEKKYVNNLK